MQPSREIGFTLIELLIVVAIIAILAAIAVPNFLEAQTRSKVSRVKADQRSLATAIESYNVDNNIYPPNDGWGAYGSQFRIDRFGFLTTPISYMTAYPKDPFIAGPSIVGQSVSSHQYFVFDYRYSNPPTPPEYTSWGWIVRNAADNIDIKGCCVKSWGPDAGKSMSGTTLGDSGAEWAVYGMDKVYPAGSWRGIWRIYDPSNGTVSAGDVIRFIGETRGTAGVP